MPTPSKFTVKARRTILDALQEGNSRETAAAMAGISGGTLSSWISRGAGSARGSLYREFAESVAMAEAGARGRALRIINAHMQDQPKWAAWYLERRDPAFAPPAARGDARSQAPVIINLTLDDGTPTRALPSSTVEVIEQDRPA